MRKILYTVFLLMLLSGCENNTNNKYEKDTTESSVFTETSISITDESVIENDISHGASEFWFDFLPEQEGEDVYFSNASNEFTKTVDINNYAYSIVVDLDNDGKNEAFVCDVSEIEDNNILTDVLYFVDENKEVYVLNEGNANIYIKQKMLLNENSWYLTINGYEGVESYGDVYSYVDNSLVNITGDLPKYGAKLFVDGEIVWCKTGYMGFCQIDENQSASIWTGRTYIPYYYKLNNNQLALYSSKEKTLDDVNQMGKFDNKKYIEAESIQYLYCENGDLRVNYAIKDDYSDCTLYTFECDVYNLENGIWVYKYWVKGYYQSNPLDYSIDEWDFLDMFE